MNEAFQFCFRERKEGSHPSVIIPVATGISFDSDPRVKPEDDACCKIPGSGPEDDACWVCDKHEDYFLRRHSRGNGNLIPIRIPGSSPRMTHVFGRSGPEDEVFF